MAWREHSGEQGEEGVCRLRIEGGWAHDLKDLIWREREA